MSSEARALEMELERRALIRELERRGKLSNEMDHRRNVAAGPPEGYVRNVGRNFMQGQTFGFSDELGAGMAGRMFSLANPPENEAPADEAMRIIAGRDPRAAAATREILDTERAEMEAFNAANPGTALISQGAGALTTASSFLKGAQALRIPTTGAKGVVATGATAGGLAGAGSSVEGERLEGAAEGAAVGGAVSVFASTLGVIGRAAYRKLAPGKRAQLAKIAQQIDYPADEVERRLAALGDDATLADVDEVFFGAADAAAQRLGPSARMAERVIERKEGQFGRLTKDLIKSLGIDRKGGAQTIEALRGVKEKIGSPLYKRAFEKGVINNARLKELLDKPLVKEAWKRARKIGGSDPDVDTAKFAKGDPSLEGWQAILNKMSDRTSVLLRDGANNEARTLMDLRKAILAELDGQNKTFARARNIWAGASRAQDMLSTGENFLASKMDREAVKVLMDGASRSDKEFFRVGIARAIERKMSQTTDTRDLSLMFRNPEFRDKVRAAFPSEAAADKFLSAVQREGRLATTSNRLRNSSTAARQKRGAQMAGEQTIGVEDVSKTSLLNRLLSPLGRPRENTVQGIGQLLLSTDPADKQAAIKMMRLFSDPVRARAGIAGMAASNLSGGAAGR